MLLVVLVNILKMQLKPNFEAECFETNLALVIFLSVNPLNVDPKVALGSKRFRANFTLGFSDVFMNTFEMNFERSFAHKEVVANRALVFLDLITA